MTRTKVVTAALVTATALAMTGCGSEQSGSTQPSAPGGTAANGASKPARAADASLRDQSFDVVSFGLPKGLALQQRPASGESTARAATWVHETAGSADCVVTVTVQHGAAATMAAYKQYLRTTSPTSLQADTEAPAGAEGVIARYRGTEKGKPFRSTVRTLLTRGHSKLTISAVAGDSVADRCDVDAVAASLRWSGTEAKASGATEQS